MKNDNYMKYREQAYRNKETGLSDDALRFMELGKHDGRLAVHAQSLNNARAQYIKTCEKYGLPKRSVAAVDDELIKTDNGWVAIRIYHPFGAYQKKQPVIFFFHGGGWVIGDLDSHDGICRYLAVATGVSLVAVDYSLSPEVRFPWAVQECRQVMEAVLADPQWHFDCSRVVVAGDSAGGNLATVMALINREQPFMQLRGQVLFYPVTDLFNRYESYEGLPPGLTLTAEGMEFFRSNYLENLEDGRDWRASPLLSDSLASLPPSFIATAEYDPLRDEGRCYARRLKQEGNEVRYLHLHHEMHGFLTVGRVMRKAPQCLDQSAQFILQSIR